MSLPKQQTKNQKWLVCKYMKNGTSIFTFENELIKELSVVSSLLAEASNKYQPKKFLEDNFRHLSPSCLFKISSIQRQISRFG